MLTLTRCLRLFLFIAATTAAPFQGAIAADAASLGTAESFAVLGSSTVTNTGPSVITGDLGLSPGTSITGFPPGTVVGGTTHATDAAAAQAQDDATAAYLDLGDQACTTTFDVPTDIGGLTLVPGVYCFASSAQLTGVLTLDAEGNADAVWIFKTGTTLTTASSSSVVLINDAQNCNVFWQVGSSATLGTSTRFIGHVLAQISITLNTDARASGSMVALTGAVTLDSNLVTTSACATGSLAPTLSKTFIPSTINEGGTSTLNITLTNRGPLAAWLIAPLTDTLPDGVTIAAAPATNCDGIVTAGTSTVTLSGGSVPANGSCLISVVVTGASCGNHINTLAAGALQTSAGNNVAPALATLTVACASGVTVGKEFVPGTIPAGGTSLINIYLSNSDDTVAVLTAPFTDTLPSGLTITGDFENSCGGTVTHTADSLTLTGGTIPANGFCIIGSGIPVTGPPGTYFNTLPAGALQTSNGSNAAPAVATLTITQGLPPPPPPPVIAPTVASAFNPASIVAGASSTLIVTLNNAGPATASLMAPLTNTLPIGVTIAGSPSNTCGGTATAATSTVTLTGGSIPAVGSCRVTVAVTAASGGGYTNSLAAGALQTSNGSNADPADASLTVVPAVTPPPPVGGGSGSGGGALPAGLLMLFLLAAAARRRRAR